MLAFMPLSRLKAAKEPDAVDADKVLSALHGESLRAVRTTIWEDRARSLHLGRGLCSS